jgi:hypothetical protein
MCDRINPFENSFASRCISYPSDRTRVEKAWIPISFAFAAAAGGMPDEMLINVPPFFITPSERSICLPPMVSNTKSILPAAYSKRIL